MDWKNYLALGLTFIAIAFIVSKGCRTIADRPSIGITLDPNDNAHAVVRGAYIESLRRVQGSDELIRKVEANYHHGVDITVSKTGELNVVAKTHGFSDDFGVSTDFHRIGVAMEPYFYKDFHALIGVHFVNLHTGRLDLNMYAALAYRFPFTKLNNLSVYGGYDTDKHIVCGLFLRFWSV